MEGIKPFRKLSTTHLVIVKKSKVVRIKNEVKRMQQIALKIPESIASLPNSERMILLNRGIRFAAKQRIKELQEKIDALKTEIQKFEAKYKLSFKEFEKQVLPNMEGWQIHEDYFDWEEATKALEEYSQMVVKLRCLLEYSDAEIREII